MDNPTDKNAKLAPKLAQPTLRTPKTGRGKLLTGGKPGHRGAGGRPTNAFLEWCENLLNDPDVRKQAEIVLKDSKHPAFKAMFTEIADRVKGKPRQAVEVSGESGGPVQVQVYHQIIDAGVG